MTRASWNSAVAAESPLSGQAHRSAVLARARDLVAFARRHGYDRDELIKIIQALG